MPSELPRGGDDLPRAHDALVGHRLASMIGSTPILYQRVVAG